MAVIRYYSAQRGLSQAAINITLRSLSNNVNHNSVWRTYVRWCPQRDIDPVRAGHSMVLNFITDVHSEKRLAIRTLQGYRTAIANTLQHITGDDALISTAPDIQRFFKGLARSIKPTEKAYKTIWDPATLWRHIARRPRLATLEWLSSQLAVVIMLTMKCRPNHLATLIHARTTGNYRVINDPRIKHTPNLDVAELYDALIAIQGTRRDGIQEVFINRQHNSPMAAGSISHLVNAVLRAAGIDDEFTPKSITHAVTTAQTRSGLSEETIKKGRWVPNSRVFQTHYTIGIDDIYAEASSSDNERTYDEFLRDMAANTALSTNKQPPNGVHSALDEERSPLECMDEEESSVRINTLILAIHFLGLSQRRMGKFTDERKRELWGQFLNVNHRKKLGLKFDGPISTNGYSATIHFKKPGFKYGHWAWKRSKAQMREEVKQLYLEHHIAELREAPNIVSIDPGKRDLLFCRDIKKERPFRYTSNQRAVETRSRYFRRDMTERKINAGIAEMESHIPSHKSMNIEAFSAFIVDYEHADLALDEFY
ncbi:uncharacterized protein EV422DRAFT_623327 [Fimicolochytrium jonesii]|uniref:uncharacterized protein n=1 Tax=Fimicolochytrium jonesii TaxID=1396493 RepID=UPI0022FDBD78|nr:uncharacterized protein EV422DRAFT_623327 [Fimicolochytrium jonesii]KAI8816659.1 hypothetical protein EV422DRAFT_623327 [Fimicolochytrium jonesii]